MEKEIILKRHGIAIYDPKKRSVKDRRRIVSWAVFSYYDENDVEYRRSFESACITSKDEFMKIAPLTVKIPVR